MSPNSHRENPRTHWIVPAPPRVVKLRAQLIHLASHRDLDDVVRLIAAFRDWWGKASPADEHLREAADLLLADPQTEFFLAHDAHDQAVGICQVRYRHSIWTGVDDAWLEDLFVLEHARGGGFGRKLVEAAFESARARGCKRIELDVNEQNEDALRFYASLGFTTEPKPPGRTLFVSRLL